MHLRRRILGGLHQADERLEVAQAQDSALGGQDDEGIGVGQVSPRRWEGAEVRCDGVTKEDARLAPGDALFNKRELLASKRMKWMSDSENLSPIQCIGCS